MAMLRFSSTTETGILAAAGAWRNCRSASLSGCQPQAAVGRSSRFRGARHTALAAGAKRLVLTHLSARYSRDARDLEREARAVFPEVTIARDGMEIEIAYEKEAGDGAPVEQADPAR